MTDTARNVLEIAIPRGREGALGMQTILWVFASSTIYVPSATEPSEKTTNFLPVLFERGGTQMVTCHSDLDRGDAVKDLAPFMVTMTGLTLLNGYGSGGYRRDSRRDRPLLKPVQWLEKHQHLTKVEN